MPHTEFGYTNSDISIEKYYSFPKSPESPKIMTMPILRTEDIMSGPKEEIVDTVSGTNIIKSKIKLPHDERYSARTQHFIMEDSRILHFTPPMTYSQVSVGSEAVVPKQMQTILAERQLRINLKNKKERDHATTQDILYNNWDTLLPYFYQDSLPQPIEDIPRFTEINLTEFAFVEDPTVPSLQSERCGVIDFLGNGPDAVIIVEFSPEGRGKSKQLGKHTRGLIELFKHHKIEPPQIIPYKGLYTITDTEIDLRFSQPAENYFPRDKFSIATSAVLYSYTAAD